MKTLELVIENFRFEVPVFEKNGTRWVALKPICDILGVEYKRQAKRVRENQLISVGVHKYTSPRDGKSYDMLCVDVDCIGEWIFGINPNKVKPEIKERMYLFRKKLQAVLYAAVTGHSDVNQIATLVEEIKQLKHIVEYLLKDNESLRARVATLEEESALNVTSSAKVLSHKRWSKNRPVVA